MALWINWFLVDLLTNNATDSTFINNNPPNTYGCGEWDETGFDCVVDSDLYFLWIMEKYNRSKQFRIRNN